MPVRKNVFSLIIDFGAVILDGGRRLIAKIKTE
jgi:hypothetical protein